MSAQQVPPVTSIGTPRITAGFDEYGRLDLVAHQEVHGGFAALSVRRADRRSPTGSSCAAAAAPDSRSPARCARCSTPAAGRTCRR